MSLYKVCEIFLFFSLIVGCNSRNEQGEIELIAKETNIKLPAYVLRIGVLTESFDSDYTRNYVYKVPLVKTLQFKNMLDSLIVSSNNAGYWQKTNEYYNFISNKRKRNHYFEMEYSKRTNILTVTEVLL